MQSWLEDLRVGRQVRVQGRESLQQGDGLVHRADAELVSIQVHRFRSAENVAQFHLADLQGAETRQVRLVSVEAERPNHPSRKGGSASQGGGGPPQQQLRHDSIRLPASLHAALGGVASQGESTSREGGPPRQQ